VPEQSVVQVMASDESSLLEGARRAADAAAAQLCGEARLALVFSCCTRAPLLRERLPEEVDLISSTLGGVPAGGFYTCGEFARVTGSTGIHNSSVALLVL
jgi:small ligand-binding sensory domain FIST